MNDTPRYVPGNDPIEFDLLALRFLRSSLRDRLDTARASTESQAWFQVEILDRRFKLSIQWDTTARLLIYGFVAGDAMGIAPAELEKFWPEYIFLRIWPLSGMNMAMSRGGEDKADSVARLNIAALSTGYRRLEIDARHRKFWPVYMQMLSAMAQAVCVEDSIRYDEQYFLRPSLLLRIFETPVCPWFRSSALETLMLGVAEMHNLPRPETGWLRDFERMRQLLDDIADIRDDLVAGRLTYPVLVGLQSDRHAAALSDQIQTVWRASPQERQSRMQNLWPTIKRLLSDADAYEACMRKIRIWERRIAEAINVGSFPGGTTYLHLVLDLKRALADRLTVQGFEDHPEPFPFFNEHEASPTWPAVG